MGTGLRTFVSLANTWLDELVPVGHFYRHLEPTPQLAFIRDLVGNYYKAVAPPLT